MQIVTEKRNASVAGMKAQREFTVKVGAHIMTVLSGLYKNPIDAMVREYTTNMYDAWLALKRKNENAVYTPCELHLPTALSPYLVFKDYGVGMDYDTVWNVYSQYGNSTKGDNNDEVGGFGLGSKTAFCYNNGQQWTIESRYDGELMTFMAFVGEDGIPNITHVATAATDELNGVTIRIPIRREHMQDVHKAARMYVPYFPLEITVINVDTPITKPVYVLEGAGWGIAAMRGTRGWGMRYGRLHVVMGNVPYVVDQTLVSTHACHALMHNAIDLHVPIGAVDIVPSRDDLKYTDRTKTVITEALTHMRSGLEQVVSRMVDSATTEWAALEQFQKIETVEGIREVVTRLNWHGKTINTEKGIVRANADIRALDPQAEITCYGIVNTGRSTPELVTDPCLMPDRRHFLMIDDTTKGAVNIAKGYCFTHLVNRNTSSGRPFKYGHTLGHVVLVKSKLSKREISDFFGGFPEDQILMATQVSGKVKMPPGMKGNDALYRFDGGKTWGARVNVPVGGPYYYLELSQDSYTKRWVPAGYDSNDVRELLEMAKELNVDVPVLYGIKKNEVSTFDSAMWKPLMETIKTEAQKIVDRDKLASVRFQRELTQDMMMMMKIIETVPSNPVFDTFSAEYLLVKTIKADRGLVNVAKGRSARLNLGVTWPPVAEATVPSLQRMLNELVNQYPMLDPMIRMGALSRYTYNKHENPFDQYRSILVDYLNRW
jgi:hypothetical protein